MLLQHLCEIVQLLHASAQCQPASQLNNAFLNELKNITI